MRKGVAAIAVTAGVLVSAGRAAAQGCALCYNDAAAQNAAGIRALRHGILILLIPSVLMFLVIFAIAYQRRNKFNDQDFEQAPGQTAPVEAVRASSDRS